MKQKVHCHVIRQLHPFRSVPFGIVGSHRDVRHERLRSTALFKEWFVVSATVLATASWALAQGDLAPPGPPAATMKTLEQIEPRVDVAKLAGDISALHVISSPGSYFLSRSLSPGAGLAGIRITASHVTLDLGGFLIDGVAGGGAAGILLVSGLEGTLIRDGSIKGFASGIQAGEALSRSRVSHVRADGGTAAGIDLGTDSSNLVEHCTVSSGGVAIRAGRVRHSDGSGGVGIEASSIVSHSHGSGYVMGISGGDVSHCIGEGFLEGIVGDRVSNSRGSGADRGIVAAGDVHGSYGKSPGIWQGLAPIGIEAGGNVSDSTGIGGTDSGTNTSGDMNGHGIWADGNVTGSNGMSYGGVGIKSEGSVANSFGTAESKYDEYLEEVIPGTAIQAPVISYSRAKSILGTTGLSCTTAVGCVSDGPDSITNKYLMP